MKLQDTPTENMAQGGAVHMGKGGIAKGAIELAKKYLTPYEIAHKTAQKNAALPISEGGLGLPANNTAMDRAKAMGYTTNAYHGTPYNDNISEFKKSEIGKNFGIDEEGFYFTSSPQRASNYAMYDEIGYPTDSGQVIKAKLNMNYPLNIKLNKSLNSMIAQWDRDKDLYLEIIKNEGYGGARLINPKGEQVMMVLDPNQIRSPNAAFDPFRRDDADILAGVGVGLPISGMLTEQPLKKAQGGAVCMDKGGLNVNATGDYGTYDSANESGSHYKLNTDIDILNKYGFGVTKEGNIVKLPERTYTWTNDGEDFSHTEPARKIKRSDISELRARYTTDDGIEYGVSRQPLAKGWAGYRRNIKNNSTIGVNVSPDYTGINYTKNFAEGGEIHPEFNFEQIKQYAEGGVVAHNDHNYAKGGPVLSVGRGEKLPVSQGAGLTAKGRAKYNSATGGNLKAPAPHPKTEKDANRRKSFCARMSGMPGPMKDENGNPTRKAASLKRWNC